MTALLLAAPRIWPAFRFAAGGDSALTGILLVVASTIFLAAGDATAKTLAASLPGIEIAWLRYAGFLAIMLGANLVRAGGRLPRPQRPMLQLVRGVGMVGSAILFTTALRSLPVAEATAISFVSPVFVTGLSIVFLGETVGLRRWIAALVGLAGVYIILRPGSGTFQLAALLPVASSLLWAFALIATRKIARHDSACTTMTCSALVGFAVLSALVPSVWVTPHLDQVLVGACIGLASTTGHWIVTLAYRHASASVLVPFSYVQIIWASLFGFVAFGSIPDGWTYAGAAILIGSGLYTAHRERVRSRESRGAIPA